MSYNRAPIPNVSSCTPPPPRYNRDVTPEDFVLLTINEQALHAWEHGRYLMSRQGQWTTANLYTVGSFYVGVW